METTTLELRKVKIASSLSEETVAFTGELWVNGQLAARCSNHGTGGPNDYHDTYQIPNGKELVKLAEEYCKGLPPVDSDFDKTEKLPMDLEFWISLEVGKIEAAKEEVKLKKKLDKLMLNNLVIGPFDQNGKLIGNSYSTCKFNRPIADYLSVPNGREALVKTIIRINGQLKPGERILNIFPDEIMNSTQNKAA